MTEENSELKADEIRHERFIEAAKNGLSKWKELFERLATT
jgi:hypothetical protein